MAWRRPLSTCRSLDVKRALGRLAIARGTSEAELIREALRNIAAEAPAPRPRLPLMESGKPNLAERLDEALEVSAACDPG